MAYMSKTKRRRVYKQRALTAGIVIAILVAIILIIWRIGLGSKLADVDGTAIYSDRADAIASFLSYQQYGMFLGDMPETATASEQQAARNSMTTWKNSVLVNTIVPFEVLGNYFKTEGIVFPTDLQLSSIDAFVETSTANADTMEQLTEHGVKESDIRYYYEHIVMMTAYQERIAAENPVTAEDEQAYYDENKESYHLPMSITASHILIDDAEHTDEGREEIESILERAKNGEDFAELATEFSDDEASAAAGGSLGSFGTGEMVAPFEEACLALEPGEISDVVETEFGYHIIQLTDKTEEGYQTLEEARNMINYNLSAERMQAELDLLTEAANIRYFGLLNPTTGKPPISQIELDEAMGITAPASDGGSADAGSADIDSGSVIADTGSAEADADEDEGSAASIDEGSADADGVDDGVANDIDSAESAP